MAVSPDARPSRSATSARARARRDSVSVTDRESANCAVRSNTGVFTRGSIRTLTTRRYDCPSTVNRT